MRRKVVILYNIFFLCFLYFCIALFFTIVYIILDFMKLGSILDQYSTPLHQQQLLDIFTRSFYFSFSTLFSIGYGDMIPLGLSKGVAIVEGLIGYVLPYAIVLNYILFNPGITKKVQSKSFIRKNGQL